MVSKKQKKVVGRKGGKNNNFLLFFSCVWLRRNKILYIIIPNFFHFLVLLYKIIMKSFSIINKFFSLIFLQIKKNKIWKKIHFSNFFLPLTKFLLASHELVYAYYLRCSLARRNHGWAKERRDEGGSNRWPKQTTSNMDPTILN